MNIPSSMEYVCMEEFHGEQLSFPRWKWSKSTSKLPFVWSKASICLIKGHIVKIIEEEQFYLTNNLSNFWIIYINPHLFLPKKMFIYILNILVEPPPSHPHVRAPSTRPLEKWPLGTAALSGEAKSSKSQQRRITGSRPRCTPLRRWPWGQWGGGTFLSREGL